MLVWNKIGEDIDGNPYDLSGGCVSISNSGDIVAIGAISSNYSAGCVRVYKNIDDTWTKVGEDIEGKNEGDVSGYFISLNADGTIIAIGSRYSSSVDSTDSNYRRGCVRVYQLVDSSWQQNGPDIDGEFGGDSFGSYVSLSDDGKVLAVGAPYHDNYKGHVRIYDYVVDENSNWEQRGADIDGEENYDYSSRVSLSKDGNRIAIGASSNDGNDSTNSQRGHVRVYNWNDSSWIQMGDDIDGENSDDYFGRTVSLRVNVIAIGSDNNNNKTGYVKIYEWNGASWSQIGEDIVGEAKYDQHGWSVSLSDDGKRVAIGAIENDGDNSDSNFNSGRVRVYEYKNSDWEQVGNNIDGEAEKDYSGFSVSLSESGNIVAIGGLQNDGDDSTDSQRGHVRVYRLEEAISSNICFRAGTIVRTDQGDVKIESIIPMTHTIRGKKVEWVSKTSNKSKKLVMIRKGAFGKNLPNQTTYVTPNHSIQYRGKMVKAIRLINHPAIKLKKTTDETIVYNIQLEGNGTMNVHGMVVETLNPKHGELIRAKERLNRQQETTVAKIITNNEQVTAAVSEEQVTAAVSEGTSNYGSQRGTRTVDFT
jgi:hypothetical protein